MAEPRLPHAIEVDLVERVIAQHAQRTTTLATVGTRVPAAYYVSDEQHRREQASIFRREPVFAGMSVDIATPSDRLVLQSGGVPIVVLRHDDGALRAYVNVCRHRADTLVRGDGTDEHHERSFVCPFHGWVYDTGTGQLLGHPRSCDGFDAEPADPLSLMPVAVAERHVVHFARHVRAATEG